MDDNFFLDILIFVLALDWKGSKKEGPQMKYKGGKWHNVAKIEAVKSLCSFYLCR